MSSNPNTKVCIADCAVAPCVNIPTRLFSLARTALGNRCMGAKGAYFHGGGAYLHCGGRVLARILANSKKSIGFIDGSGGSYLSDPSRSKERHAHGLLTTHYYSLLSVTHCSLLFMAPATTDGE